MKMYSNEQKMTASISANQNISGKINASNSLDGAIGIGGTIEIGGTMEHNRLLGREKTDAHPIEAISNLPFVLDEKMETSDMRPLTNLELKELLK